MYNNESHSHDSNNTNVVNAGKEERVKYAYLLLGHYYNTAWKYN